MTLEDLAKMLEIPHHGDGSLEIRGVCSLENVRRHHLMMVETAEQLEAIERPEDTPLLHPEDLEVTAPGIASPNPRQHFAAILAHFHPAPNYGSQVHESAVIDPRAEIAPSAFVGPHCVIGPLARIGERVVLQAFVSVGEHTVVHEDCRLMAHSVVGRNCELGRDCQLEAWSHLGDHVVLGDAVDLGAHTSLSHHVVVGAGAKLDNLVVVGPRSQVGAGCLLVAQSSVDRDAQLHPGVILAGQASVGPEAELVSGIQLGGRSWALGKLDKPGPYLGNPARPLKEELRRQALEKRKPQALTPNSQRTCPSKRDAPTLDFSVRFWPRETPWRKGSPHTFRRS